VAEPFFDTNVLVYLLASDPAKATRARELLAEGGAISVQVLNEFVAVARRKHALRWDELEAMLEGFKSHLRVQDLTVETHARAVTLARRHRLAIYDATILAAAEQAGCTTVLTEDMHNGHRIGDLTIRNPFAAA
jgi:predicted nucleic acid-binding protein